MGCAYSVSVNRSDRLCCKACAYFLLIIMQKCSVVGCFGAFSAVRVDIVLYISMVMNEN